MKPVGLPRRSADSYAYTGTAEASAKPGIGPWIRESLSPSTILTILTILAALAVTHGRSEQRMDQLEAQQRESKAQFTPRTETESQNQWLRDRLNRIEAQQDSIFRLLMERK